MTARAIVGRYFLLAHGDLTKVPNAAQCTNGLIPLPATDLICAHLANSQQLLLL